MRYTYPLVFEKNELGGYSVWAIDLPECYTDGDSFEDAISMAGEAMELVIESYIDNARTLPSPSLEYEPKKGERVAFVSCNIDEENRLVNSHSAASLLGVSDARVRQLIRSGQLESKKQGRDNYVYLWSVRDRLNAPRSAGRPISSVTA